MKFSFHRPSDKETEEKIARLESRLAIMQANLESHNARLETQLRLALVEQFDKHRDDLLAIINYLGYGIMKRPVFGEPALPESPDLARLHELAMKDGSTGSVGSIGTMDHLATGTTGPIPTPMPSRGPSSATRRRRAMTEMAQEYGLSGPSISDIPEVEQFRDSLGSIGIPLPPKPDPIPSSKSQVQSPNPPPPERPTD